jgi:hypothetical protein
VSEKLGKGEEVLDKPSIKVGKSNKGICITKCTWCLALFNGSNYLKVHFWPWVEKIMPRNVTSSTWNWDLFMSTWTSASHSFSNN